MTLAWFGAPWPCAETRAPVCASDANRIPTPVGTACLYCGEKVVLGDQGTTMPLLDAEGGWRIVPAHRECSLRAVLGGPAHVITKSCSCCGGEDDPDLGLDYRSGAVAVAEWVERQRDPGGSPN